MKGLIATTVAAVALQASAGGEAVVHSGWELRDWCEAESQLVYLAEGLRPDQWSAMYWERDDVLYVKGSWRLDSLEVIVDCHIDRDATRDHAVMTIHERR